MLKRLIVKNYRSLRELDISLRPLMVLVGPNASGKSNLLDVFRLVRDSAQGGIQHAYEQRRAHGSLIWNGDQSESIVIEIVGDVKVDSHAEAVHYQIGGIPKADGRGFSESGRTAAFNGSARQWAFYHFAPPDMRPPRSVQKQSRLNETGSNLSTVIHSLFSESDPSYQEIEDLFKVFVPEVEKLISPLTEQGTTYAAYKQKGLKIPIGTGTMSDGTLFGLALIVALFAPDRPQLIGIEAPDMEMHPYLMEHVAERLANRSNHHHHPFTVLAGLLAT